MDPVNGHQAVDARLGNTSAELPTDTVQRATRFARRRCDVLGFGEAEIGEVLGMLGLDR
ncbi:hypothetical protein C8E95_6796 [Pseudonocardia autotrophica]|uniref:Uncharacterized protein n=2 Tax=Pseudonocardia TaxID=1847 RepID=A0A1Y2N682_PSEAH|nr:hypothetical protein BG845_01214 [Pseudonocardia autotrophica]TDN77548.1 hypothetical protein C8E95_6796 [Pseudonocardia autotrophica]BBG01576.1 hypothetical protein Pdca_27850 [Pseudonocardia autotrophica]GEC29075.1 hypothetical protein PSA01_61040 [Pseudonocardia saturnea]